MGQWDILVDFQLQETLGLLSVVLACLIERSVGLLSSDWVFHEHWQLGVG